MRYLELLFNRPLPGSYTYICPDDVLEKLGLKDTSVEDETLVGRRVHAPFGRQDLVGFIIAESVTRPAHLSADLQLKNIRRIIDDSPVVNQELSELARWMSSSYFCATGEALAAMIPSGKRDAAFQSLPDEDDGFGKIPTSLSDEQERAVTRITSNRSGQFYVYGITGSGKTEVFLQAARKTLDEGRSVIYLVPEISLTHQVVSVIRSRFEQQSAVLHSSLTPSQRIAEWRRIFSGEARFVIGARSAIFAPLQDIGLVIIDEEHEGSYKSGSGPRYHARQIAMKRAATHQARLVMGSATPSVEAWHHMEEKRLEKLVLSRRLSGGGLPSMEIVSLKGSEGSISSTLLKALRENLASGRQSILFLNRRGFGYFYHCKSCGQDFSCTRCSVSLTYHKHKDRLVCHHCGYRTSVPANCPTCGSLDLGYSGFGTERVEEDVASLLPNARVVRLDTDSTRKKGVLAENLAAFRRGEIDILLGTQMVAKGLNFPGVSLVGIILADSSLHLPDFRSQERSFALITQVAGRAGRYRKDGRVIIQTLNPEHPVIRQAAAHEIEQFYHDELAIRAELKFPPFTRVLRLIIRGRRADQVWNAAGALSSALRTALSGSGAEILGPGESPLTVVNKNYRVHLMILVSRMSVLQINLPPVFEGIKLPSGVHLEIDPDPQSML